MVVPETCPAVREPAPSLSVNFLWALAGNVFYAAAQWGVIVLLARLGNPATVGQFALSLAITSPILTLTSLQLRTVLATDVSGRFRFGHSVALRILGTGAFLAVVAVVGLAGRYDQATLTVLAAVTVMKASESLTDVGYGVLQSRERMARIAASQILKGGTSLALMLAAIVLSGSCLAGIIALSAGFVLTLLVFDFETVRQETGPRKWRPDWHWPSIAGLLNLSWPLGSTLLLASLNANIPRYVLEHDRGVREVGVFSAIAYIAVSANLLVMALGQALAPRMAKAYGTDMPRFRRLSRRLFAAAAAVGVIGLTASLLAGNWILELLYGAEYAGEKSVFVWLMIAGIISFSASAAGFSLTSARYFRVQFPVLIVACLVTFGSCALLVPSMGLAGAAIGQACGSAVQLLLSLGWLLVVVRRDGVPSDAYGPAIEIVFKREI